VHANHPNSIKPRMILRRYLATELLVPACLALGAFILVVLTKDLASYSELVINRGAGLARIGQIVFFQALTLMSQMLPFAVLIGALVGLGRLTADLEILVMSALGIEPRKLIAPVALFGASAAALGLVLALVVAPWAHRGLDQAFLEIAEINPAAEIQPGVVSRFGDWKLEAHGVSAGGHALERVVLWIPSLGETVFAETAEVAASENGELEVAFQNGAMLLNAREAARSIRFEEMRATLPRADAFAQLGPGDRLAGLSLADLLSAARDPAEDSQNLAARSELHRRSVLPIAAALFAALAVPLALARGRASRSDGAVLGLAITVAYYGLMQLAEGITQRAPELAVLAAWLPNAVLLVSTFVLYQRLARPFPAERSFAPSEILKRLAALGRTRSDRGVRARRWALPRYVAGLFLQLALLSFAALVAAYLLIDILERLQWFARHAATTDEFVRFYSMRIPLLVSRVAPMGLLVAMALTISQLTTQGELVGMRACGIPAARAMRPALLVCLVMTPLSFLLNDQIVPRTNELADLIKQRDIKDIGAERNAVWRTKGRIVYELASLNTSLGTADEIVVYRLGPDGLPESRLDAGSARYVGDGRWRMRDATAVELGADGQPRLVPAASYAELGEVPSDELDLKSFSVWEVRELIRDFASTGDSTTTFEVALHVKLATPLACLVLPALLMAFAVTGPPFPSSALTLILSGLLAVGYTLAAGAFASFGRAGALPAWLGGWAPILIASAALGWLAWRARMAQRGEA
jgi:lipopolysaccharide export system permease protein